MPIKPGDLVKMRREVLEPDRRFQVVKVTEPYALVKDKHGLILRAHVRDLITVNEVVDEKKHS